MKFIFRKKWVVISILLVIVLFFTFSTRRKAIDFNTQVKPIFNKKCITCHGGVRRKSGFSVLFRSEALAKAESGKFAIIPGDPDHSEMIRRFKTRIRKSGCHSNMNRYPQMKSIFSKDGLLKVLYGVIIGPMWR